MSAGMDWPEERHTKRAPEVSFLILYVLTIEPVCMNGLHLRYLFSTILISPMEKTLLGYGINPKTGL
jgi:hypothetical protein